VTPKLADEDPAGSDTDTGTTSKLMLVERDTTVPPAGAAFDRLMLQVAEAFEPRTLGVQAKELTRRGATI
jgi:hypothetical protein